MIYKKLIAVVGVLVLSLNLSACCCLFAPFQMVQDKAIEKVPLTTRPVIEPTEATEEMIPTWPVFIEPETEATAAPEMTFEEVMEKIDGIWIFDGTVWHMYDDQYSCEVLSIRPEMVGSAVYPGGGDRPGMITEYEVLDENTIWLGLTYEAGEFMGDYLPEGHSDITVTWVSDNRINVKYGQGSTFILYYGGQDYDEVNETCRMMLGN